MTTKLTEREKLHIRAVTIQNRLQGIVCHRKPHLLQSLTNAIAKTPTALLEQNLTSAKTLQRNCLSRTHRALAWVPSHFKARIFNTENGLNVRALNELKQCYTRSKKNYESQELGNRIPNSAAEIWRIDDFSRLSRVMLDCKRILLPAMLQNTRVKNNPGSNVAITEFLNGTEPLEVNFISYKRGLRRVTGIHEDGFAILGRS